MQAAQDRMSRRLGGEGFEKYQPPEQAGSITDALMASRMQRMGILDPQQDLGLQQPEYGQRFADNPGGGMQSAQPPPPPPVAEIPPPGAAVPPPGAGVPPPQTPPPELRRPDDFINKKGRIRRRYRPGTKAYIGDDEMMDQYGIDYGQGG